MAVIRIDDKYSVLHEDGTNLRAERYGEPWRDLCGDGLVLTMAQEIESLRVRLSEVHDWIALSDITSAEDMMQNADHIEFITRP